MDITLLFIILIIISGLIAYIGDQIGMKVGRKRLSLFGLRPKHTSILVTILTGILITTITITFLLITSRGVRMALFNMEAMVKELNTLSRKVEVKDDRLSEMQGEIDAKGKELNNLKKQKGNIQKQLQQTIDEYKSAKEKLKKSQKELERLTKVKKDLLNKVDDLGQEVKSLEGKIKDLNKQKENLEKRVDDLSYSLKFVGQKYLNSMTGDIVYQKGEIIYSKAIQAGKSDKITVESLDKFIMKANQAAVKKGIKENEDDRVIKMYEDDLLRVAKTLRQQDQQMVVRLIAQKNTLKDEEVLARFKLYEDHQVYRQNQLISRKQINNIDSLQDLEDELESFLTEINNQAIKDGLIPNSQGKVGNLNFSRFYSLFNKLQKLEKPVQIKVVAKEDIWRSDSLTSNIKFVVRSLAR
ncbi:DUF3084 domain-containing protein [Selenihalanaerobacter shriftii]|uniref:DUF3084 domain-containing protein n=1 Tax=Selenihalanaerobacter shriftii TaxID=142842 RepID=A0A1T4KXD6_9FIRM|nr:DUF3084 domain-containing protein [Selenihalanaerobacter shriftii]SJZ47099.1 Protein of unknown function [Selenihalanaerobacter shriftii]